ncbi:Vps62-related protein [Streptomyces sp. MA5143a]|uniref:Vps62-related protein n=1 Tax=Streptomyces sp. MA5143a TaxID=2083010 RepID=UPI0015E69AAD|nr:Vps62-related protein [Streptomyces sp. MA5143a]
MSAVALLPVLAARPAAAQGGTASAASLSAQDAELARRYAPLVRLERDEEYFPSDVESFLSNTHVETHREGDNPNRQFRVSNQPLGCDSCTEPAFLSGWPDRATLDQVPAYAEIVHRTDNGSATDITDINYWMFYPYNRGKRVCMTVFIANRCLGGLYSTFGHHVGDWEHVTLRLVDNEPHQVSMSQHNSGQTVAYGREIAVDGTQPLVYAAWGSHGLYPAPGDHTYLRLPNGHSLVDRTSNGPLWDTRKALKVFSWQPAGSYTGDLSWLNYTGRWGNPKSGCAVVEAVSGECMLNAGPEGPNLKEVFGPRTQPLDNAPDRSGGSVAE